MTLDKTGRFFAMTLLFIASLSLLSACNTVEGMGQDIRKAGETISDSADKTKKKM